MPPRSVSPWRGSREAIAAKLRAYRRLMNSEQAARLRAEMVERQLRGRGIRDENVLAVMAQVPRELFVPVEMLSRAYLDGALPIAAGQTISQPYMVAHMTELLELRPGMRVLEVGTGSGHGAAVRAGLGASVISDEPGQHGRSIAGAGAHLQ